MTDTCTRCGQTIGHDCGCTEIERLTADRDRYKARADHALALVAAEREACAELVKPNGDRPCDCDSCYCGNPGDQEAVASWDAQNFYAKRIRARATLQDKEATND